MSGQSLSLLMVCLRSCTQGITPPCYRYERRERKCTLRRLSVYSLHTFSDSRLNLTSQFVLSFFGCFKRVKPWNSLSFPTSKNVKGSYQVLVRQGTDFCVRWPHTHDTFFFSSLLNSPLFLQQMNTKEHSDKINPSLSFWEWASKVHQTNLQFLFFLWKYTIGFSVGRVRGSSKSLPTFSLRPSERAGRWCCSSGKKAGIVTCRYCMGLTHTMTEWQNDRQWQNQRLIVNEKYLFARISSLEKIQLFYALKNLNTFKCHVRL